MPRLVRGAASVGAMLALASGGAFAQRVRVVVRGEGNGAPVRGAVLSLLSSAGATVSEGLTDSTGSRLLAAPAAGTYRVRVRRIGFEPYVSQAVQLDAGVIVPLVVKVPNSRVRLAAMRVTVQRPDCRVGATVSSPEAASVWEQIKTALVTSELSRRDSIVRTEVRTFERDLSPRGRVLEAHSTDHGRAGAQPFGAAEPAQLLRTGYVAMDRDLAATYWAPDARVLVSPGFAQTHCFGLVQGRGPDSARVGLTFEPTRGRRVPDIEGTVWVDREHVALQRVDFDYVNIDYPARVKNVGGVVEFTSLPSGGWYPSFWRIRMPRFRRIASTLTPGYSLAGYTETGGIASPVERLRTLALAPLRPELEDIARTTTLRIRVTDGGSLQPLAGAEIELPAAGLRARSDSVGRVTFSRVPQGAQRVRERRVGFVAVDTSIDVRGDTLSVDFLVDRSVALLDAIRVHAAPVALRMEAFAARRAMGVGRFLTDSAIAREQRRPVPMVLVSRFPGLRLVPVPPPGGLCEDVECSSNADQPPGTMHLEATGSSGILFDSRPTCPVDVYVDGFFYMEDLEALPTSRLLAAELYDKSSAPSQYRRPGKACKVLLLWTKNQ